MLRTIAIQGVGALSTILLTGVVSRKIGIEGQGHWSELKATVEFLAAFLAFGFPSSITYFIHKKKQSIGTIAKSFLTYITFALTVTIICGYIYYYNTANHLIIGHSAQESLLIYLTGTAISIYFFYRGLCLALSSNLMFDIVTASLPLSLLLYFWVSRLDTKQDLYTIYLTSMLTLVVLIVWPWHSVMLKKSKDINVCNKAEQLSISETILKSAPNFGAIVLPYLQPFILYKLLEKNGYTHYDIGIISLCILLQGAALLIPNILSPRLYKDWTIQRTDETLRSDYRKIMIYSYVFSAVIYIAFIIAAKPLLEILTGRETKEATWPTLIILSTLPLSVAVRPMLNICLSQGGANHYMVSLLSKLIALGLVFLVLPRGGLNYAAFGLAIAEIVGFLALVFLTKRLLKWPYTTIIGFK